MFGKVASRDCDSETSQAAWRRMVIWQGDYSDVLLEREAHKKVGGAWDRPTQTDEQRERESKGKKGKH